MGGSGREMLKKSLPHPRGQLIRGTLPKIKGEKPGVGPPSQGQVALVNHRQECPELFNGACCHRRQLNKVAHFKKLR